jgi:curved DNA-binding protein CbpA
MTNSPLASHWSGHYHLLGLHPAASAMDIRRAYRQLSKEYHPDTTSLPTLVANAKFQELNQAYAILSNPTRRLLYDQSIGYSRVRVMQASPPLNVPAGYADSHRQGGSYSDERPLSPGEIFMLLLLGGCFAACILLVLLVATWRGELG